MLTSLPSPKNTGIGIYGDSGDLTSLHTTIHKLANSTQETYPSQSKILMGVAYEARHAAEGHRLKKRFTSFYGKKGLIYYGFYSIWTDILVFSNVLRFLAGRTIIHEEDQANLYMLEWIIKESLHKSSCQASLLIREYAGININVSSTLLNPITEYLGLIYLKFKPLETRFQQIPNMIDSLFRRNSVEQNELIAKINKDAIEFECEPEEVTYREDYPNIIW